MPEEEERSLNGPQCPRPVLTGEGRHLLVCDVKCVRSGHCVLPHAEPLEEISCSTTWLRRNLRGYKSTGTRRRLRRGVARGV